jgi:hypothetical protein
VHLEGPVKIDPEVLSEIGQTQPYARSPGVFPFSNRLAFLTGSAQNATQRRRLRCEECNELGKIRSPGTT